MSSLSPRKSIFWLFDVSSFLFDTGAHSAVTTPAQRKMASWTPSFEFAEWDLVAREHRVRAAGARILHLFGQVLKFDGSPVADAAIEIRQHDARGRYPDGDPTAVFLGIGRTTTDFEGRYQFRTILPDASDQRTAVIDARVTPLSGSILTTQLYLLDHPANDRDPVYQSLGPAQQAAVSLDPVERADGELVAGFNFVV